MPLTAHGEQSALRSHRTPNTAASTAPLPASVTIMIRPSGGVGCESCRCDLGQMGTEIFFGKSEIRLDNGQITCGCSPDGAKRNPGPASRESRISLRCIRATMFANVIARSDLSPVAQRVQDGLSLRNP